MDQLLFNIIVAHDHSYVRLFDKDHDQICSRIYQSINDLHAYD